MDPETKRFLAKIAQKNDQLLKDVIETRDHWRYKDDPGRAGKPQGKWKSFLLRYFYEFQAMLHDF